jgi:hypothetical protein
LAIWGLVTVKVFVYLLVFLIILAGVGLGFVAMVPPKIPQETVKVDLDPQKAFGTSLRPASLDAAAPTTPPAP